MSTRGVDTHCTDCGKRHICYPLHDDRGGPLRCFLCAGMWHAKYTRRRKWGRIVVKSLKMYFEEGGDSRDLDKLKLAAWGYDVARLGNPDTVGAEVPDLTSELLGDILQLVHPDRHPAERRELANRVSQELLALKPFIFPKPKPKPANTAPQRDASSSSREDKWKKLLQPPAYPCELCDDTVPFNYCNACRAEYDKRRDEERERRTAKQREQYARRQWRRRLGKTPPKCEQCGTDFKPVRRDARYCSAACRQRAHRHRVTDKKGNTARPGNSCHAEGSA